MSELLLNIFPLREFHFILKLLFQVKRQLYIWNNNVIPLIKLYSVEKYLKSKVNGNWRVKDSL